MATFDTFLITKSGGRAINMDAVRHVEHNGVGCWVIADGLGAYAHSEVAAQLAVDAVTRGFSELPGVSADHILALVKLANRAVFDARSTKPELREIATTLVVLISDGRHAIWAHVGDSRLYHVRGGRVVFQTRDHSIAQAMQGPSDELVERDSNALIKAIGMRTTVGPRVSEIAPLRRDDAFLLCVDGFWEKVSPVEMEIDFAKSRNARDWLRFLEHRVASRQTRNSDNYTALTVRFADPRLPASEAMDVATTAGQIAKPDVLAKGIPTVTAPTGIEGPGSARRIGTWSGLAATALALLGVVWVLGMWYGMGQVAGSGGPGLAEGPGMGNLSAEDRCLLAWAKIEDSRDPSLFNAFSEGAQTKGCAKQTQKAKAYSDELKAYANNSPASIKALSEHIAKYPDRKSAAVEQLALLLSREPSAPIPSVTPVAPAAQGEVVSNTSNASNKPKPDVSCADGNREWNGMFKGKGPDSKRGPEIGKVLEFKKRFEKCSAFKPTAIDEYAKTSLTAAFQELSSRLNAITPKLVPVDIAAMKMQLTEGRAKLNKKDFESANNILLDVAQTYARLSKALNALPDSGKSPQLKSSEPSGSANSLAAAVPSASSSSSTQQPATTKKAEESIPPPVE